MTDTSVFFCMLLNSIAAIACFASGNTHAGTGFGLAASFFALNLCVRSS